jgi:uncharacterized protein YkwD
VQSHLMERVVAALLLTPIAAGATRNDPGDAEDRLAAAVVAYARAHGGIELQVDPDLSAAAREHSEILATGTTQSTQEFLRQCLSAHGVMDPFPYVFYGSGPPERTEEIEQRLQEHLRQLPATERRLYTHVGVGIHTLRRRRLLARVQESFVTVLLTQRAVSFSPLPADLRPGERFLFEGELHPPFRDPEILITRPDGNTDVLDNLADDDRRFRTYVRLAPGAGEYQLEVMGRYDMGPRVLALASLHPRLPGQRLLYESILEAARKGTLEPALPAPHRGPATEREAEALLLRLLNRDRERSGLPPLAESAALCALARGHSADMRDRKFFAHVSPRTGRLSDRAENAGVPFRRIGENIAVGADVIEAEAALLRSPGHRMNILDPEYTQVGVGVAFDTDAQGNRRVFMTQNFMVPQ